jgi:hypothetical protein
MLIEILTARLPIHVLFLVLTLASGSSFGKIIHSPSHTERPMDSTLKKAHAFRRREMFQDRPLCNELGGLINRASRTIHFLSTGLYIKKKLGFLSKKGWIATTKNKAMPSIKCL